MQGSERSQGLGWRGMLQSTPFLATATARGDFAINTISGNDNATQGRGQSQAGQRGLCHQHPFWQWPHQRYTGKGAVKSRTAGTLPLMPFLATATLRREGGGRGQDSRGRCR